MWMLAVAVVLSGCSLGAGSGDRKTTGGTWKQYDLVTIALHDGDRTALVTASVERVGTSGKLELKAKKSVTIDTETVTLEVAGTCWPSDIGADNTVDDRKIQGLRVNRWGGGAEAQGGITYKVQ